MGRSLLKCFRPENQLCLALNEDAAAFCSCLAEDIEKLEMSLADDSVSLRWCVGAMSLLKRMQRHLLGLLKKSTLPVAFGGEGDWFDQYMKESVTLLDFCNSLKIAVSGINRCCMAVDLAARRLDERSSSCMATVQDMEREYSEKVHARSLDVCLGPERLRLGNGCSSGCNRRDDTSMAAVLLAARATTIAVSLLLVSAMTHPISITIATETFSSGCPEMDRIVQRLAALVDTFHERTPSHGEDCRAVLAEQEMVHVALGDLKAQVVEGTCQRSEMLLSGLEKLRTRSCELREGINRFSAVVDEVFEEAIRGRDDMLRTLRKEA